MYSIPKCKKGDCSICGEEDTNVVKRGKELICLKCIKGIDSKKQMVKQSEKESSSTKISSGNKKSNAGLSQWFLDRHEEMTGVCLFCGGKTCAGDYATYKRSVAHLLAKRDAAFPSVATHKDNSLELCFWSPSCHTNFDNGIISFEIIKKEYPEAWKVIVTKFKNIYPCIAENEKKNIPEILMKEL